MLANQLVDLDKPIEPITVSGKPEPSRYQDFISSITPTNPVDVNNMPAAPTHDPNTDSDSHHHPTPALRSSGNTSPPPLPAKDNVMQSCMNNSRFLLC